MESCASGHARRLEEKQACPCVALWSGERAPGQDFLFLSPQQPGHSTVG
uniref:Uncharacterized protein n=1 Tax=Coccidioides posadasii RMSCC 3488 TaxID=454284 RepID=A0A0J6IMX4_COCPO|nr:hypothetical protein CPAG_09561 [Coccidioides posadasii RMSCC 3488]